MSITLPTEGFITTSGIHRDYKDLFIQSNKRRGVYKAVNIILIRLTPLLKIKVTEANNQFLNDLYSEICNDDDVIFVANPELATPLYNLIAFIKQSLKEENPIAYVHSKVSLSTDHSKLTFNI